MMLVFFSFSFLLVKSQVNPEFRQVKEKFQQHRVLLDMEFSKRQNQLTDAHMAELLNSQRISFFKKLDSVENSAFVGTLVKVKNLEDLSKISKQVNNDSQKVAYQKDAQAVYPGGIDAVRSFVSENIYTENVNFEDNEKLTTKVQFVVERDGSISQVKADGSSPSFNRQGEIVLYLLPDKFSPAYINGFPVRSYYSIPITIAKN
ncbi:hypothetical protein [Soonwooa sp.]|uniref:energy transducer TonB n=1 Tax=Soonwooa sp. TaxID=1938592 RepID=UPI0026396BE1|nr:hypothetical protein [Soonwooa sp.]